MSTDAGFMDVALSEASRAGLSGEVPVGAVVVADGKVVGRAGNAMIQSNAPTAHAELMALRRAGHALGNYRLPGTTLYSTVEPCLMCFGAAVHARVERFVYGCADPKGGFLGTLADLSDWPALNHRFEVTGGVLAEACSERLSSFFRALRQR